MSVNCSPFGPSPQFELSGGLPNVGGLLFFYAAGSSQKQDTYATSTGLVANTNPIVLNSLGMPATEIWFTAGASYKVVYAPAGDTDPPSSPIRTWDNLTGITSTAAALDQWVASGFTPTYISATQFSVVGDQRSTFEIGRRLKSAISGGTGYHTITNSTFGGGLNTVTVSGTALDAGLSAISYGLLSATNSSLPRGAANFSSIGAETPGTGVFTRIKSIDGSQSAVPTATPTTLFTVPTNGRYKVYAYAAAAAGYDSFAEVSRTGSATPVIMAFGGVMTFSLTGTADLQITQSSGSPIDVSWLYQVFG
jgi:hypothetical protein